MSDVSIATGGAGLNRSVTFRRVTEVFCERAGQQLRPFTHWCVCAYVSMAPGRRLNIGEARVAPRPESEFGRPGLSCSERRIAGCRSVATKRCSPTTR